MKIGAFDTKDLLIREMMKDHIIIKGVEVYYEGPGFLKRLHEEAALQLVAPSDEMKSAYLKKAESNLISARLLLDNDLFEQSVSMAYYSMHYSVLALSLLPASSVRIIRLQLSY